MNRLEQCIVDYKSVVNLFEFLQKIPLLRRECLLQAASKLIEAYPKNLEPELQNQVVQFVSFISQKNTEASSESVCSKIQLFQLFIVIIFGHIFS